MSDKRTIYKYPILPILITDFQTVPMPFKARILCFQLQDGVPTLWAEARTEDELVKRGFAVCGTGQDMPFERMDGVYVGTIQLQGYVWHLYDWKAAQYETPDTFEGE